MVEDQASCDEVIHQLFAVQGALGAVCRHMVEGDIHRCLEVLRLGESPDEMNLALEKILHLAQIIRAKVRTPERVQI
jgi:DNA-binding FrmR family transcriptional regulator